LPTSPRHSHFLKDSPFFVRHFPLTQLSIHAPIYQSILLSPTTTHFAFSR
jgi:hypothetical protein